MQKSLLYQELAVARRNNSIMLGILFVLITLSLIFAFGNTILYMVALFGLPIVMFRIGEELHQQYLSQKPQDKQHHN